METDSAGERNTLTGVWIGLGLTGAAILLYRLWRWHSGASTDWTRGDLLAAIAILVAIVTVVISTSESDGDEPTSPNPASEDVDADEVGAESGSSNAEETPVTAPVPSESPETIGADSSETSFDASAVDLHLRVERSFTANSNCYEEPYGSIEVYLEGSAPGPMRVMVRHPPEIAALPHDDVDFVSDSPDSLGGSVNIFSVCVTPGSEFRTYNVEVRSADDESLVWLQSAFEAT